MIAYQCRNIKRIGEPATIEDLKRLTRFMQFSIQVIMQSLKQHVSTEGILMDIHNTDPQRWEDLTSDYINAQNVGMEIPDMYRDMHDTMQQIGLATIRRIDTYMRANFTRPDEGYAYLMKAATGEYKLGKSNDPVKRARQISTASPVNVQLIHVMPSNQMSALEYELHTIYRHKRIGLKEWFNLSPDDVEDIQTIGRIDYEWVTATV